MPELSLEKAPRKAREQYEKGLAALERGNLDYGMDMFEAALEISPDLLKARRFLRAAAIKKSKSSKGGGLANAMSSLTGLGSVFSAQSQIKKKPGDAVKTVEKLLRKAPLNMQFINLMVQAATAAEMPEVAIMTLELAKEQLPGDVDMLRMLAKLYQDNMMMHDARVIYEDVLTLRPNDPKAIKDAKDAAALDTMQRGQWEDQTSDFRTKLKNKGEAAQLEREAKAVASESDLSTLIREARDKVKREPQNINYKRALAEYLTKEEQFDEALKVLADAQAQTGGADPQIDRMISNIRIKQFDGRISTLESAGKQAEAEAARSERADFVFADAEDKVRRYPNDLQFKYELGVLLYERGALNEAIQMMQMAQRNPQRRIRALYYLALCFKQKGQFDIALEQLQKANSELTLVDETKKDILYELGTTSEAMNTPEKAVEYFKEIYSVDISYRDVAQRIEKYYKR